MKKINKHYLYIWLFSAFFFPLYFCQASRPTAKDSWINLWEFSEKVGYDVDKFSVEIIVGSIITTVLSIMGIIFLILVIYGGYLWFTASGDKNLVEKAQHFLRDSAIGFALVIGAYAITYYIVENFIKAAGLPS